MAIPRKAFKRSLRPAYDYVDGLSTAFVSDVGSTQSVTISSGEQGLAFGTLTVDGTYTIDGELRVTDWPT